jgi:hypothetical protein
VLSLPALARAHYVWIESETTSEARFYFGEYNEGVREKAGGRLDERAALEAWLERGKPESTKLQLTPRSDHFFASLNHGSGWLLARDVASEVKDYRKSGIGIVKPMFYARAAVASHAQAPARPSLELDIIPVAGEPQALQVSFGGQPLAGAKLLVYAPNLWMQELKSDERGRVAPKTPWPGRYVLDVVHMEAKPGEYKGQRYEAVRHRATYSFVTAAGAAGSRESPATQLGRDRI